VMSSRPRANFAPSPSTSWTSSRDVQRPVARYRELDEMDEPDEHTPVKRVVAEQQFKAGDRVTHPSFGEGVVVNSRMTGDDEQVEVLFKGNVTKKLSMAFAPLQRV
jgi:PcrA/UvrD helicase-like protein